MKRVIRVHFSCEAERQFVYRLGSDIRESRPDLRVVPSPAGEHTELLRHAILSLGAEDETLPFRELIPRLRAESPEIFATPLADQHQTSSLSEVGILEFSRSLQGAPLLDLRQSKDAGALSSLDATSTLVSFGIEGLDYCVPYAAIVGRPTLLFESIDQGLPFLQALPTNVSLFCALPPEVGLEAVDSVFKIARGPATPRAIGFFYPCGRRLREYYSIKLALHEWLPPHGSRPRTFVVTSHDESRDEEKGGDRLISGRGLDAERTLDVLARDCLYSFVTGHSNGIDMDAGSVILCARQDFADKDSIPPRSMPCFSASVCHRKNQTNILVPIGAFKSRILCLENCFGVYLAQSYFDSSTSISFRASISPENSAFIGTLGARMNNSGDGFRLIDELDRGTSIGTAIALLNSEYSRRFDDIQYSMILFGDPELRVLDGIPGRTSALLEQASLLGRFPLSETRPDPLEGVPDRFIANLSYFRSVLADAQEAHRPALDSLVDPTRRSLEGLWAFCVQLNQSARVGQLNETLHARQILELGNRLLAFQTLWLAFFESTVMERQIPSLFTNPTDRYFARHKSECRDGPERCSYCGEKTLLLRKFAMSHVLPEVPRLTALCLNCGPVFDSIGLSTSAILSSSITWDRGSAGEVTLRIERQDSGVFHVAGSAILEPAYPPLEKPGLVSSPCAARIMQLVEISVEGKVELSFPPLASSIALAPGGYMLNVGVLFNEQWILARHFIYLSSEGSAKLMANREGKFWGSEQLPHD